MASIQFLGAAGTVTGSRFLVSAPAGTILVDAGLFQGPKELRLRNRAPFPVPPDALDALVLTHAHLDHSGALPLLWRQGFRGPVHCTPATRDQAAGTRGWSLQNGARTLRMHGEDVPVAARVLTLTGLSAHGDRAEVDRWLATLPRAPERVFCVHGEPAALAATAARLAARGLTAVVPRHGEAVALG